MGWQRRGCRSYFYWTRRVGKRFVCTYIGGPLGELAASLVGLQALDRREASVQRRRMLEEEGKVLQALQRFIDITSLLARATLLGEGFHRHDRGKWRKRRHGRKEYDGER